MEDKEKRPPSPPRPTSSPASCRPNQGPGSPRFSLDESRRHQTDIPGILRQFRKAKSAATFTLDGISYTIVASSTGGSSTEERKNSIEPEEEEAFARRSSLTLLRRTYPGSLSSSRRRASSSTHPASRSGTEWTDDSCFTDSDSPSTSLEHEKFRLSDALQASQVCSVRLKQLLNKLENGYPDKDYLLRNIEYVARILDIVFFKETESVCDDEDELNKVETEAVPTEVRDWLAMTFTRPPTLTSKRQNSENKPKFRSVANAIRAGIHVDRLWRRLSAPTTAGLHIPSGVLTLLKNIDDWSFNVFAVNEASDGHALKYVGYELLQRHDLIAKFKINVQVLENFLARLEHGYSKYNNPYHNLVHAADVAQTMHHVISKSGFSVWLTDLEILSAIVSSLIHDFEHTGTTNTFHVNTSSDVALLYNDKAVLENHHVSSAFRMMKEDDYNIVSGLKTEEYREFRSLVIDIVLATDMSFHFQQIKNMRSHLSMPETIDKTKALSLTIHCADISHPAKDWNMHHRWTELLIEEFFRQGDREKILGLPISPLCDRKNTLVAQSQIGFIDFIVHPSLDVMGDMIEKILTILQQQQQTKSISEKPSADKNKNHSKSSNSTSSSTTSTAKGSAVPGATTAGVAPTGAAQGLGGKLNFLRSQKQNCSPGATKIELARCWDACLAQNRSIWKERAAVGWISPLQEPNKSGAEDGEDGSTLQSKGVDGQVGSGLNETDTPKIT